ncbi:Heat shock protein hsp9, partial [Neolecta irregularis DAH-3]
DDLINESQHLPPAVRIPKSIKRASSLKDQTSTTMSDTGRKDFSTQAKEKLTPEDQKTYMQQAKETVTGVADKVSAVYQGDKNKSTTQKGADSLGGSVSK